MDVRSIDSVKPSVEHDGTVDVWWLYKPREMHGATDGGYLELVSEFEIARGQKVHPHRHPTFEFYYVTRGRGVMQIGKEKREVYPGDLVKIPPNEIHSLWPASKNSSIHCFCFAIGLKGAAPIDYTTS